MSDRLRSLKIAPKLFLAIVGLILILVTILGVSTYLTGRQALYNAIIQDLSSNALEKETAFHRWVESGTKHVAAIAETPSVRSLVQQLMLGGDIPRNEIASSLFNELNIWTEWEDTFESFLVIHPETGEVLIATNPLEVGQFKENRDYFLNGRTGYYFEYPFYSISANSILTVASAPILDDDGQLLAVLAGHMKMDTVADIIHQRTGTLTSEEALVVNRANLLVIAPVTGDTLQPFVSVIRTDIVNTCLRGESGTMVSADYRDVQVIAVRNWLPEAGLCLVMKVNQEEALQPVRQLARNILLFSFFALLGGTIVSLAIARTITRPVQRLVEGVNQVTQGNLDHVIPVSGQDEIATLTQAFNQMTAARKQIARNRDRLLSILEATPDFVVSADMEGKLFYANAAARKILGIAPDTALAGWRISDTHPPDVFARITEQAIPTAIRQGTWTGDSTILRVDGQMIPVSQVILAHKIQAESAGDEEDGSVSYLSTIARDLTQRRQMEMDLVRTRDELEVRVQERTADLAESEQRYRLLAHNFPDGAVLLFDQDLRYRIAGGAKLADLGLSEMEMEGHTLAEVHPAPIAERLTPIYQGALRGNATKQETLHDDHIYTEHTLPVRNSQDEIVGGLVLLQDITARRQMEAILTEKAIELARSNADLEQVSYVSAHNLQEPLRKIRTFSDWLTRKHEESSALDERSLDYLTRISASAGYMQQLLDDMLVYSRISMPEQAEKLVNLSEIIEYNIKEVDALLKEADAQVTVDSLPTVFAQESQMKMLFRNLLANAIKFRRPDVPLSIQIRCGLIEETQHYRITIQDNGIGFDEKYLDLIFVPLQRLHNLTAYDGTGMGLAICRRILDQYDGQLTAQSQPGQGATFIVTLPFHLRNQRKDPASMELTQLIENFQSEYSAAYGERSLETGWKRYAQD